MRRSLPKAEARGVVKEFEGEVAEITGEAAPAGSPPGKIPRRKRIGGEEIEGAIGRGVGAGRAWVANFEGAARDGAKRKNLGTDRIICKKIFHSHEIRSNIHHS